MLLQTLSDLFATPLPLLGLVDVDFQRLRQGLQQELCGPARQKSSKLQLH